MYENQFGNIGNDKTFRIKRGVRQGDVLSSLLFNAATEMVIRRWKQKLTDHGIKLSNNIQNEKLTNIRFADDLIIYAHSLEELTSMIDLLVQEFATVGLQLNSQKSKIFILDENVANSDNTMLVDVADGFVQVVQNHETHKYLGMNVPGDLRRRGNQMMCGRIKCAWAKFHMFRSALTNKHVQLKLRIRLFESVVLPTAMYGLATAPMTGSDIEKLAVEQRKMLRLMIGYVKFRHENYADMYRRLRIKIENATNQFGIRMWSDVLMHRKQILWDRLENNQRNTIVCSVFNWCPTVVDNPKLVVQPYRSRGRPVTTWHQHVTKSARFDVIN